MESRDSELPGDEADFTAAVPLEIDEETAARTDDLLREFAEDAGLETALVVDRSGALVAGISSEADVTVEIISALVAGASGAMRALVARLGETGAVESLHFGGNRLVYLKETVHRFILVAVAETSRPAGLVRQKAHSIEDALAAVLGEIRPAVPSPEPPAPPSKSLRDVARERAAQRVASLPPELEPDLELAPEILPLSDGLEDSEFLFDPEPDWEEAFAALDLRHELAEEESEPAEPGEPKEVHEPIDFGEPEIVIEPSIPSSTLDLPVDSPFEEDDWEEKARLEEEEAAESGDDVPESLDEDEEELPVVVLPPPIPMADEEILFGGEDRFEEGSPSVSSVEGLPEASFSETLFEEIDLVEADDEEEEETESVLSIDDEFDESDQSDPSDDDAESEEVFEFDEGDEDSTEESPQDEDPDEIAREIEEMIAEEDEESEIRGAGPFYF